MRFPTRRLPYAVVQLTENRDGSRRGEPDLTGFRPPILSEIPGAYRVPFPARSSTLFPSSPFRRLFGRSPCNRLRLWSLTRIYVPQKSGHLSDDLPRRLSRATRNARRRFVCHGISAHSRQAGEGSWRCACGRASAQMVIAGRRWLCYTSSEHIAGSGGICPRRRGPLGRMARVRLALVSGHRLIGIVCLVDRRRPRRSVRHGGGG